MEVEFERGLHNNYMVIKESEDMSEDIEAHRGYKEDYQVHMLSGTGAEGFLPLKLRYFNGRAEFCYDISLKQRFSEWFKTKKVNHTVLCSILESLCNALENALDYMLEVNHIVLEPDYIFVDTETYALYLCCCPFYDKDILRSGQEFLQYLLEILDYGDKAAVEAGYEIFRICMKDGFHIELLKSFLTEQNEDRTKIEENDESWNSVIPVNVMKEEVEDECEKSIIPYIKPKLRIKICMGLLALELMVSLIFFPNFRHSSVMTVAYVLISILVVSTVLLMSVFYKKAEKITRLVSVKGYVTYANEKYSCIDDVVWNNEEEIAEKKEEKYEETVLLAYMGKEERLRRLHYIGTRNQEDIMLAKYPFTVGKSEKDTDYSLSYPFVSRVHFRIEKEGDRYFITDTNSRNGLLINDIPLNATETRELMVGDRIELGDLVFLFQ